MNIVQHLPKLTQAEFKNIFLPHQNKFSVHKQIEYNKLSAMQARFEITKSDRRTKKY